MPTGAARHNLHLFEGLEIGLRNIHFIEKNPTAFLADTAEQGVFDGSGLLEDFLEHEMLVATLFRHDRIPQNVRDWTSHNLAIEISKTDAFGRENSHIAVV